MSAPLLVHAKRSPRTLLHILRPLFRKSWSTQTSGLAFFITSHPVKICDAAQLCRAYGCCGGAVALRNAPKAFAATIERTCIRGLWSDNSYLQLRSLLTAPAARHPLPFFVKSESVNVLGRKLKLKSKAIFLLGPFIRSRVAGGESTLGSGAFLCRPGPSRALISCNQNPPNNWPQMNA